MTIGIIGSGTMGRGIAQVAATAGHDVVVYDNRLEALEDARHFIQRMLNRQVEKGRMTDAEAKAIFGRIRWADTLAGVSGCQLVIEAIVENLDVKQAVFRELEDLTASDTILATNTSSLSVTSIAAACRRPERVIGIHFFNPAPLMRLVEVAPALQTADEVRDRCVRLVRSWGKLVVVCKDTPGFIVNRVARPFYSEALRIYEEGIADMATIDWAMTELGGFRMGPFTLMDFIGNDVNYAVTESTWKAFFHEPRYKPSFTQKRLVEAGWLGRKTGRGYYDYREGATPPEPVRDEKLGRSILHRIRTMLINEAADALFWGVATAEDIDLAMTTGVNYPKGLLAWADELGIQTCVKAMDALYDEYREDRYRCSPMLRRMAREGRKFFPKGE
ncbi:MAG: 3-hydroxybutyryl-CoA dehydrogenase, partial [Bacteroidetes bacterium]